MAGHARKAEADDLAELLDMMTEFYAESNMDCDRSSAADAFSSLLSEPSLGCVWVLQSGGMVAGYVVLTLGFSMEYGGPDGFIDDLFVRETSRGHGLGRLALKTVVAESRKRGVRVLHLEVDRANEPAQTLYRRFGFRENERRLMSKIVTGE